MRDIVPFRRSHVSHGIHSLFLKISYMSETRYRMQTYLHNTPHIRRSLASLESIHFF